MSGSGSRFVRDGSTFRIDHSAEDLDRLRRGFIAGYGVLVVVAALVALVLDRSLLLPIGAFAAYLVWWSARTMATRLEPHRIVGTPTTFTRTWTEGTDEVRREQVARVERTSVASPRTGVVHGIRFRDADGHVLLHLSMARGELDRTVAVLREWGWPVAGRR